MQTNRLGVGGNLPPSEMEILQERFEGYTDEAKQLDSLSQVQIPDEIGDDKHAGKISDHIKSLKIFRGSIGKIFTKEKELFLKCGKIADQWKNGYWREIDALIATASTPVLAWNKKKEEEERKRQLEISRKAREAALKLEQEAAAHSEAGIEDTAEELMDAAIQEEQKAAMITDNAVHGVVGRSRGEYSSSSNRKPWTGVLDSRAALDFESLRNYFTEDDLNKAIKKAVRDGVREIRGARIYQEDKLSVR